MEPTSRRIGTIRVLVVEDEFLIADWVAECLVEQGFIVHTAHDANEALQTLNNVGIDLLFTDINLPGSMDGLALAQRARQMLPNLPVIYASASVATLAPEALVPNAVFLRKPYGADTVGRLIAGAVRAARQPAFA